MDSKFNLKVVDFGSARYAVDQNNHPITYVAYDGVGTVKCNAPELTNKMSGKGQYSPQAIDTFAAGCFLF